MLVCELPGNQHQFEPHILLEVDITLANNERQHVTSETHMFKQIILLHLTYLREIKCFMLHQHSI